MQAVGTPSCSLRVRQGVRAGLGESSSVGLGKIFGGSSLVQDELSGASKPSCPGVAALGSPPEPGHAPVPTALLSGLCHRLLRD